MAAPLSYLTRDKESIKLFDFYASQADAGTSLVERRAPPFPLMTIPKAALWSPDGMALALVDPAQGVQVLVFSRGDSQETSSYTLVGAARTTQSFIWSPKSSFVVSVAPGQKGQTEPNIHVWRKAGSDEGFTLQASYSHPKLEKGTKVLQWTPDESLCARLLPNGTVHILQGSEMAGQPLVELKLGGLVQCFEFAPVRARGAFRGRLALFVPDSRDDMQRVVGPAEVHIFELASIDGGIVKQDKVKANVTAGQVADLQWNSTGSALIAHCQTEVDETGMSYYGGSKLILISSDGECQKDIMDKHEGLVDSGAIVQACAWSPTRDEFILIHGFQPSQATLFCWDEKTKKVTMVKVLLTKAHRNTIRFNHFGSLVCLAGFGNLAGQVDFFGRAEDEDEQKCDYVRISACNAECTVSAEWAPDGRHFITSVLAPRMRVDNGTNIWIALSGTRVCGMNVDELYDVQWRPEPPDSLRFLDVTYEDIQIAAQGLAKGTSGEGAGKAKQAYRPPKARGEGASTVAAMMRGEVAAPDADDRRKRQPRQIRQRDEDANPERSPDDARDRRAESGMPEEDDLPPWYPGGQSGPFSRARQDAEAHHPPQPSPERAPQHVPQTQHLGQQQLQERLAQQVQHQQAVQQQQQQQQQQLHQAQQLQQRREAAAVAAQQAQQQQDLQARQEQALRQRELAAQLYAPAGACAPVPHQQQRELAHQAALRERAAQQQAANQQAQQQAARDRAAQAVPSRLDTRLGADVAGGLGLRPEEGGYPGGDRLQLVEGALATSRQQMEHLARQQAIAAAGGYHVEGYSQALREQQQHHEVQRRQLMQQQAALEQQQQQRQLQQVQQERQRQQHQQLQQQQQQATEQAMVARARAVQQQQQQQQQQLQQQQQQQQGQRGAGQACPVSGWEYIDPKGNKQGPFPLVDMQQWHGLGYFRPELPMRCDSNDDFIPFGQLFPQATYAFQCAPKRPPPKYGFMP